MHEGPPASFKACCSNSLPSAVSIPGNRSNQRSSFTRLRCSTTYRFTVHTGAQQPGRRAQQQGPPVAQPLPLAHTVRAGQGSLPRRGRRWADYQACVCAAGGTPPRPPDTGTQTCRRAPGPPRGCLHHQGCRSPVPAAVPSPLRRPQPQRWCSARGSCSGSLPGSSPSCPRRPG